MTEIFGIWGVLLGPPNMGRFSITPKTREHEILYSYFFMFRTKNVSGHFWNGSTLARSPPGGMGGSPPRGEGWFSAPQGKILRKMHSFSFKICQKSTLSNPAKIPERTSRGPGDSTPQPPSQILSAPDIWEVISEMGGPWGGPGDTNFPPPRNDEHAQNRMFETAQIVRRYWKAAQCKNTVKHCKKHSKNTVKNIVKNTVKNAIKTL